MNLHARPWSVLEVELWPVMRMRDEAAGSPWQTGHRRAQSSHQRRSTVSAPALADDYRQILDAAGQPHHRPG
jgi:hypothetical protein